MTTPLNFDPAALQVRDGMAEVVDVQDVDGDGIIECKIAPYEVEAAISDGVWEVITRGAFGALAANPGRWKEIHMSNQGHDLNNAIGVATELRDESDGVYAKFLVPDVGLGANVLTLIRKGVLSQMSAEFKMQKKGYAFTPRPGGGQILRQNRATLLGVSPVRSGAYGDAARVLSVRELNVEKARELELAYLATLTAGPKRA